MFLSLSNNMDFSKWAEQFVPSQHNFTYPPYLPKILHWNQLQNLPYPHDPRYFISAVSSLSGFLTLPLSCWKASVVCFAVSEPTITVNSGWYGRGILTDRYT